MPVVVLFIPLGFISRSYFGYTYLYARLPFIFATSYFCPSFFIAAKFLIDRKAINYGIHSLSQHTHTYTYIHTHTHTHTHTHIKNNTWVEKYMLG